MKVPRTGVQPAFTLVELLVVIGVLAILAGLLLPTLIQAKRRAQQIQCVSNLRQLGIALHAFLANNHRYPSYFANTNGENPGYWAHQLMRGGFDVSSPATNFFEAGVWRCPSAKWSSRIPSDFLPSCYGYNAFGLSAHKTNALGLFGHYDPNSGSIMPLAESEVAAPAEMMAIGESFSGGAALTRESLVDLESYGNTLTRHRGNANVLFCDGHVESPTLKFLFEDTGDAALSRWNRDHLPHRELVTE